MFPGLPFPPLLCGNPDTSEVPGGRRMAGLDPKVAPQTSAASDTQWLRALERCNRDNDGIDVLVWLLGKGAWCREHYLADWDDANTGVTILHFVVYGLVGTLILAEYWSQSNSDSAGPESPQSTSESPATDATATPSPSASEDKLQE